MRAKHTLPFDVMTSNEHHLIYDQSSASCSFLCALSRADVTKTSCYLELENKTGKLGMCHDNSTGAACWEVSQTLFVNSTWELAAHPMDAQCCAVSIDT